VGKAKRAHPRSRRRRLVGGHGAPELVEGAPLPTLRNDDRMA